MGTIVGFIGLGNMGEPMARCLLKAGYTLRIYNRTAQKAAALSTEEGAQAVATPAEAAGSSDMVITMLANDQALEEVTLGAKGLLEAQGAGAIHLSMSTVSPELARRLAARHQQNRAAYVAAPVFGRPPAAAAGKLWICTSGSADAKARVQPLLQALGQGAFDFGEDPGAANLVKLAGNFLIAAATEAMAEAFALAEKNGIERTAVAAMLTQTLFACPLYQTYGKLIAEETYEPPGFKLIHGLKDLNLVQDAAETARVPMPLASLVHDRLLSAVAKGRQELDWTALALGASEDAGLKP